MEKLRRSKFSSRVIVCVLVLLILAPPISFFVPQQTEAAITCPFTTTPAIPTIYVPVWDIGNVTFHTQTALSTNNNSIKECILDLIIKLIVAPMLHEIVTSVIEWINNDFNGEPAFVQDPGGFFTDILDEEFGRFIDGSALGFLCDPLKLQIQLSLLSQHARYRTPARCTITGIIQNFENFADNGDFAEGGWTGWYAMVVNPVNNPYGSYFATQQELALRVQGRQATGGLKLDWGKGFQSFEKCTLYVDDDNDQATADVCAQSEIQTPGTFVEGQLQKAGWNDVEKLNLAQEFDDIIIALANFAIRQIMTQGLSNTRRPRNVTNYNTLRTNTRVINEEIVSPTAPAPTTPPPATPTPAPAPATAPTQ